MKLLRDEKSCTRAASIKNVRPRRRGFSLVEVVIVVMIIGAFSSIAIPRYVNSLVRYRADATARRVVADLALAKSSAKQSSSQRQVAFDAVNHTYQIQNVKALDSNASDYDVDLTQSPYRAQIDSVDFGGDADLVFDGHGVPDSTGFVQIKVGSEVRKVNVDPITGKATIQ